MHPRLAEQGVAHNGRPFLTTHVVPCRHETAAHDGRTVGNGLTGMHLPFPFTTTHLVPTKHVVAIHGLARTKYKMV